MQINKLFMQSQLTKQSARNSRLQVYTHREKSNETIEEVTKNSCFVQFWRFSWVFSLFSPHLVDFA
jgi:hypothetical protein